MDFFKSVFSDDPDPPESQSDNAHRNDLPDAPSNDSLPTEHRSDPSGTGAWDFGGLLKTLSLKSESIIETYRRDLQEFGTGLKKEIEVAQGSLESVGHAIDHLGNTVVKGTAQIISQSKDAILDSDNGNHKKRQGGEKGLSSKRYCRFDSQVRGIQGDVSTYTEVPEDLDDYNRWKSEVSLEGKSDEIEGILRENETMESVYKKVVPNTVDRETFWFRYYYKVYKLKKAEDVRARLVKRMSKEEEDLSWDVDDDDDDDVDEDEDEHEHVGHGKPEHVIKKGVGGENSELQRGGFDDSVVGKKAMNVEEVHNSGEEGSKVEKRDGLLQSKELGDKMAEFAEESKVDKSSGVVQKMGYGSKETSNEVDNTRNKNNSAADSDKKVIMERTDDAGKSAAVASQHSVHEEEEDLEWDEIEDLSIIDEKKATRTGSPSKVDLRKRLNAAQEEEEEEEEDDLSWEIEDDDEPVKA
ncbi:BSD domain-containing protein C22A12.14c-like [Abrus precatorius]|uniref:BSD domain-containing protein C22A12.14c-like n=1 Tax=Abrus precatorius TaxID=3816 RepID=A0A8B8LBK1_ABRPR|nr:BSD domain-containing protein C22A12.14c-like [Abrus precatorius]